MDRLFTEDINYAAKVLKKGGIVAFPTETYYGLAVDIFNEDAVKRLFELKNRDASKPLPVLIDNSSWLPKLTKRVPDEYVSLIECFWPGPLTLIFKASKNIPEEITGHSDTIGIRISSDPMAQELCSKFGSPITATSANLSGLPPAETHEEVYESFGDYFDCIVINKKTPVTDCSTIVSLNKNKLVCLREGVISFQSILSAK